MTLNYGNFCHILVLLVAYSWLFAHAAPKELEVKIGFVLPDYNGTGDGYYDMIITLQRAGAEAAMKIINNSTDILDGIILTSEVTRTTTHWGSGIIGTIKLMEKKVALVFGEVRSIQNIYSGAVTSYHKTPQLCTMCGTRTVQNRKIYPYFFRSYFPGEPEAFANLCEANGWNRVAVVSSLNSLSIPHAQRMMQIAQARGLRVVNTMLVDPVIAKAAIGEERDFERACSLLKSSFDALKKNSARIFVVFTDLSAGLYEIYYCARYFGMVGEGYVWVVFNIPKVPAVKIFPNSAYIRNSSNLRGLNEGYIYPSYTFGNTQLKAARLNPDYQQFTKAYESLRTNPAMLNSLVSNPEYVTTYLNEWEKYWDDGTQLISYDMVMSMAKTWDRLIKAGKISKEDLANGNFRGHVSIDDISETKHEGLCYNYQFTEGDLNMGGDLYMSPNDQAFQAGKFDYAIATTTTAGIQLNPDNPILWSSTCNTTTLMGREIPMCNRNTVAPVDGPIYKFDQLYLYTLKSSIQLEGFIIGLIYITFAIFNLFFIGVFVLFYNDPTIKNKSPPFTILILIGILLWIIDGIVSMMDMRVFGNNSTVCHSKPWLLGMGFSFIMASLIVKSYRLWKIFDNKKAKRLDLRDGAMLKYAAVIIVIELVVLIAWSASNRISFVETTDEEHQRKYLECGHSLGVQFPSTTATIFIINAIYLIIAALLAWQVRNVPKKFGESSEMLSTIYAMLLSCIIILPSSLTSSTINETYINKQLIRFIVESLNMLIIYILFIIPPVLTLIRMRFSSSLLKGISTHTAGGVSGSLSGTASGTSSKADINQSDGSLARINKSFLQKNTKTQTSHPADDLEGSENNIFKWKKLHSTFGCWTKVRINVFKYSSSAGGIVNCIKMNGDEAAAVGVPFESDKIENINSMENAKCCTVQLAGDVYIFYGKKDRIANLVLMLNDLLKVPETKKQ